MRRRLDDVDWKQFKDDHGKTAGDVPRHLRALASPKSAARQRALDGLHARLLTLGTVNWATVAAVPFLSELCADEALPERHLVIGFVYALITSLAENSRGGFGTNSAGKGPSVLRALRAAARREWSVFARCATAQEAAVRCAAAAVLPLVAPVTTVRHTIHRAFTSEADVCARASQLLALGVVGRRSSSLGDRPTLLAGMRDRAPLVRVAAAIALVLVSRSDVPDSALDELAEAASLPDRPGEELPWNGGRIALLAAFALADVATVDRARALVRLRTMLAVRLATIPPAAPAEPSPAEQKIAAMMGHPMPAREPELPPGARDIAEELLRATLGDLAGSLDKDVLAEDLDAASRSIVADIAIAWRLELPYQRYGLPARGDIARWLGVVPPRGLERAILVRTDAPARPTWQWLRDLRRDGVGEEELADEIMRVVGEKARIEIVHDVLQGAYARPGEDFVLRVDQLPFLARLLSA